MGKKFLSSCSFFFALVFVLTSMLSWAGIFAQTSKALPTMGSIEEIISSYYDPDGRPMSCAHRAITYIGNPIPENSLVAIQDCIDHKVDIVELDIMRTSDGVFVLCHDNSIKRTTTYTGSKSVSQMTYAEICQYPLLQYTGGSKGVYYGADGKSLVMPTFEEALKLCKDNIMINLDKFTGQWAHRMELYELVRANGCLDNVMFKGGYDSNKIMGWHAEIKAKYGNDAKMPNFCTLNSDRNTDTFLSALKKHAENKTAYAVEAGFSDYTQPQSDPKVMEQAKGYIRTFGNVLFESIGGTHSAKNKENSTGWAEVISLGYNILQTNNSADLAAYIYANYSTPTRDISKGLDTLYFNYFKHNQTSYSIQIQAPSVRLSNGDYIGFKNVDMSSSAGKSLIANISSHSSSGKLVIRSGSTTGTVIAEFDMSKQGAQSVAATANVQVKNLGVCDIYICAENMPGGYVSLSKLICADPQDGKIVHINGLNLFTKPKIAPKLPSEVTVVTEYGFTYSSKVTWAPVPASCYSEELSYFTVPGVLRETCEKIYATVTVLDVDMTGAARWYDSSIGVVTNASSEVLTWYDRINSSPATASTSSAPKYSYGKIVFDGSNDNMLYNHSLSGKSEVTMLLNAKTDKRSTDYFSDYKINNTARYTLLHYPESGGWGSVWLTGFKNGIACRFGSGVGDNRGIYYTATTINGWNTVSAVKSGTTEKLYLNSSMVYNRSDDTSKKYCMGVAGSSIANTHEYAYIGLGIQNSTNYYYQGSVSDIVVFERALSEKEINKMSAYFSAKNNNTLKDKSKAAEDSFSKMQKEEPEKLHTMTCKSSGSTKHKFTCSVCSYSFTEDHVLTCKNKDETKHEVRCEDCSYKTTKDHVFEKVLETPATDDAAGSIVNKCKDCSFEIVTEIPRISYTVTLVGATSEKTQYYKGETVTIVADTAPDGMIFDYWFASDGVSILDIKSSTSSFVMPATDVHVESKYAKKLISVGDIKITVNGYGFLENLSGVNVGATADGVTLKKSEWFAILDKESLLSADYVLVDDVTYKLKLAFDVSSDYSVKELTSSMIIVDGVKAENVSVYSDGSLFIEITLEKILHDHVFDQKVINEDTLKSQADCLTPDVYYYSCICGDISENDTFEVNSPLEHIFTDDCDTLCDREGCEYLRPAQHVFSTDYKTHENGHSEYCVKCDQELDLEKHEYKFGKCKICGFKDPDTIIPMVITASVAVVILSVAAIIIILIIKKKKSVNK